MHKKLTITVEEDVYRGLHRVIGRRRISQFIEKLVRPHVVTSDLDAGYAALAKDTLQEAEAKVWTEGTLLELPDEAW